MTGMNTDSLDLHCLVCAVREWSLLQPKPVAKAHQNADEEANYTDAAI